MPGSRLEGLFVIRNSSGMPPYLTGVLGLLDQSLSVGDHPSACWHLARALDFMLKYYASIAARTCWTSSPPPDLLGRLITLPTLDVWEELLRLAIRGLRDGDRREPLARALLTVFPQPVGAGSDAHLQLLGLAGSDYESLSSWHHRFLATPGVLSPEVFAAEVDAHLPALRAWLDAGESFMSVWQPGVAGDEGDGFVRLVIRQPYAECDVSPFLVGLQGQPRPWERPLVVSGLDETGMVWYRPAGGGDRVRGHGDEALHAWLQDQTPPPAVIAPGLERCELDVRPLASCDDAYPSIERTLSAGGYIRLTGAPGSGASALVSSLVGRLRTENAAVAFSVRSPSDQPSTWLGAVDEALRREGPPVALPGRDAVAAVASDLGRYLGWISRLNSAPVLMAIEAPPDYVLESLPPELPPRCAVLVRSSSGDAAPLPAPPRLELTPPRATGDVLKPYMSEVLAEAWVESLEGDAGCLHLLGRLVRASWLAPEGDRLSQDALVAEALLVLERQVGTGAFQAACVPFLALLAAAEVPLPAQAASDILGLETVQTAWAWSAPLVEVDMLRARVGLIHPRLATIFQARHSSAWSQARGRLARWMLEASDTLRRESGLLPRLPEWVEPGGVVPASRLLLDAARGRAADGAPHDALSLARGALSLLETAGREGRHHGLAAESYLFAGCLEARLMDLQAASDHLKAAAHLLLEELRSAPSLPVRLAAGQALRRRAAASLRLGRVKSALRDCARGVEALAGSAPGDGREAELAELHRCWGLALYADGRLDDAAQHLEAALSMREELLARGWDDPESRWTARVHADLASVLRELGAPSEASHHLEQAAGILRSQLQDGDDVETRVDLALVLREQLQSGDGEDDGRLAEALAVLRSLVREHHCLDLRADLVEALRHAAAIRMEADDAVSALPLLDEAEEVCRCLLEEGDPVSSTLAHVCNELGLALAYAGDVGRACEAYDRAVEQYDQEDASGRDDVWETELAAVRNNRGLARGRAGRADEAQADFDEAIRLYERYLERDGGQDSRLTLALACYNRGRLHQRYGLVEQALADYSYSIELIEASARNAGEARHDLADVLLHRAEVLGELSQWEAAVKDAQRADEILEREPAEDSAASRARAHCLHGDCASWEGRAEDALARHRQSLALHDADDRLAGRFFLHLGQIQAHQGLYSEAETSFQEAIRRYEKGEECKDLRSIVEEASAWRGRGEALDECGGMLEAGRCHDRATTLLQALNGPMAAESLSDSLQARAAWFLRRGLPSEALADADLALEVAAGQPLLVARARIARCAALLASRRHVEALGESEAALSGLPAPPEHLSPGLRMARARALACRGVALRELGRVDEAVSACEEALLLCGPLMDSSAGLPVWPDLAELHYQRALGRAAARDEKGALSDVAWAIDMLAETLIRRRRTGLRCALAHAHLLRARLLAPQDQRVALADLRRATSMYALTMTEEDRPDLASELVSALEALVEAFLRQDDVSSAQASFQQAETILQRCDPGGVAFASTWCRLAALAQRLGLNEDARDASMRALAAVRHAGDAGGEVADLAFVDLYLAGAESGPGQEALADCESALERLGRSAPADAGRRSALLARRGWMAFAGGRWDAGLADLDDAARLLEQDEEATGHSDLRARVLANRGVVRLSRGMPEGALEDLAISLALLAGQREATGCHRAAVLHARSRAFATLGRVDEALGDLGETISLLAAPGVEGPAWRKLLAIACNDRGRLRAAIGEGEASLADLDQAVALLEGGEEALLAAALYNRCLTQWALGRDREGILDCVLSLRLFRRLTEHGGGDGFAPYVASCRELLESGPSLAES